MDQFRIKCFIALAEELHFGRAAARCHISQPAMSQQIQRLEDELHVQLAHRTKRSVSLTPAGQTFFEEAIRIDRSLDQAINLTQLAHAGSIGRLTIGVTSPALYVIFPEIARAFRRQHPGVELAVREMPTAEQERALRRDEIDVGIGHPPLDDETLSCVTVAAPRFNLAIPEEHWLASSTTVRIRDLVGEPLILWPRQIAPSLYDAIIEGCVRAGFSPSIGMEAHPAQSIVALAAAGMGIGIVGSPLQMLPRPGVVFRSMSGRGPRLNLGVAFDREHNSSHVAAFVAVAQEVGAELGRSAEAGLTVSTS